MSRQEADQPTEEEVIWYETRVGQRILWAYTFIIGVATIFFGYVMLLWLLAQLWMWLFG